MGCGCGGGGRNAAFNRQRRAAIGGPASARLRTTTKSGAAAAISAQSVSALAIDPNTKSQSGDDRRRIEKLRRQAIMRSLGR